MNQSSPNLSATPKKENKERNSRIMEAGNTSIKPLTKADYIKTI